MRKLKFFTIVMLSLVSMNLSAQKSKKLKSNEARVLYSIKIDCTSCEKKLNDKVPFFDGIKDVKVNLEKQTIMLVYQKNKTDVKKIAKELKELGYPAKEINTEGRREKKSSGNEAEITFSVPIDCGDCVKKLNNKVPYFDGVKDIKISLENKTIWVAYRKDKTDVKKIAAALKEIGFPAVAFYPAVAVKRE